VPSLRFSLHLRRRLWVPPSPLRGGGGAHTHNLTEGTQFLPPPGAGGGGAHTHNLTEGTQFLPPPGAGEGGVRGILILAEIISGVIIRRIMGKVFYNKFEWS
jgi:hypothetical protein